MFNRRSAPTHAFCLHTVSFFYHSTLLQLFHRTQSYKCLNKPTIQMLSCHFFPSIIVFAQVSPAAACDHGKQKRLSVWIWLCVLNGLHLLIWAQQKFPSIGWLIVRLSAYLSSSPSHLPLFRLLPSILPPIPTLLSAQGLIDQPCPGSCPLISQPDVFCVWVKWINYWANRTGSTGPREPVFGPWVWVRVGWKDSRGREEG